ncbi:MAG: tRNA pseudouridine(38-40) synthase TruA [Oscillatoriales cyanobacterium SM2_2_1]|nr:tRNA pseudouridine(38-40) synthase TruA [Oscillatoriales cyanobacterium SM2_2_1]
MRKWLFCSWSKGAVVDAALPLSVRRVALVIQYIGLDFCGWQRQSRDPSVQQTIEDVLSELCNHPITLHGAGRTDTGVHAAAQVAHFDTTSVIPPERWAKVLNARLPNGILIRESAEVPLSWHARFSATWRRYRYTLFTAAIANLFIGQFSWHYYLSPLDAGLMQAALEPMLGEQDLAALQRSGSQRRHARLEVQKAVCWREQHFVYVEVQASGFLYGMMRLLVGLLVDVGRSQLSVSEFTRIWQQRLRHRVKYAAPPQGLCLLGVGYREHPFGEATCQSALFTLR